MDFYDFSRFRFQPIDWVRLLPDTGHLAQNTTVGKAMSFILCPWPLLLITLAGWLNREQQQVIEYLVTENQVLKEKLGKKRSS